MNPTNNIIRHLSPQRPSRRRSRRTLSGSGGCDFPARPGLSALAQPVFWSPAIVPSVITFMQAPQHLSVSDAPPLNAFEADRESPEGRAAILGGDAPIQILLLPGANPKAPVAALIPLDGEMLGRIEALTRLWSNLRGRDAPPDMRMTLQQRRRVRLMIQAADGRMNGASYRDIAIEIYGKARVSADPWKTSSIRASVIGLVKGGLAAINGGYLKLLRHRRRS